MKTTKIRPSSSEFLFFQQVTATWIDDFGEINVWLGYFQKAQSTVREAEMQSVINGHKFLCRVKRDWRICADTVK